ncbi:MAG: 2-amino-3-ketobutyrate coenzyme A ligase [Monoraphidium minutum]|nr:MAG: 2-amino-3-ketobutyrate coenzyme A ligase [Monoraphidium minutum]
MLSANGIVGAALAASRHRGPIWQLLAASADAAARSAGSAASAFVGGAHACRIHSSGAAAAAQPELADDPLQSMLSEALEGFRAAGTLKTERVITTPQGPRVGVESASKEVLNFCANNYLGLSNHPAVAAAAIDAIKTHGFGLSSVRFICGTQDLHKRLEARISEFHGTEDTILYPSCFDANAGLFEALLTAGDAVISDELNHASIIDGIRLCKAQRFRYKHMDMADLERCLQQATDAGARIKLVATDGVFSMDGDIAPLDEIVEVVARFPGAYLFVDECHATGFLGATGRGTDEAKGVWGRVDVINSTLGKALGGATGGYTTGRADLVALLRQRARPYLFSNTLAPAVAGASLAVFDILTASTQLRDKLEANTRYFRDRMAAAGFALRPGSHPIVPIMLGDAALAATMAARMLDRGVYVVGFSYPVVPKGQARIRVQLSAAHSQEDIDAAVGAFVAVGRELGVVQG